MSALLRCQACGGSIVWDASCSNAACLYCGTVALQIEAGADIPSPEVYLVPDVSADAAEASFRTWAGGSWFRPKALRDAEVELSLMLIPAWRFHARLETHWAGLESAATRSGHRPVSGLEHADLTHLVVASSGLSQAELATLLPFEEEGALVWEGRGEGDGLDQVAWEPPALTRRGARAEAHAGLADRHRRQIARAQGLDRVRVAPLIEDRDVRLMMVPIYIGAFRHDDRPWRVVINAQSGKVVGEAPVDWRKVALVVGVAVALILAVLVFTQLGIQP